jgi:deoxyribodipyrimidine photo-lyase
MHNRVRMIVASFLVKDLLIDWRRGAGWFEDTLVDADLANNRCSWQWIAGSGADASPFFRIFNPVTQGDKFDPAGDYVRAHLPELGKLDPRFIHKPWEAPRSVLVDAGIVLGENYPMPMIDHAAARRRALGALADMKAQRVER